MENISPDRHKSSLQMTNSLKRSPERYTYSNVNINSTRQFSNSPKMSPKISPRLQPLANSHKKAKRANKSMMENLDPGVPSQDIINSGLKDCGRVLKTMEKEIEFRLKEKKTLQIVVDQLKKDVLLAQSKNSKYPNLHKKWENQAISQVDAAAFKESQRGSIIENIEKTKEELNYLDETIQEDIKINREVVLQIHKEKEIIMKYHRRVDKLKRANMKAAKEKERWRNEALASAKNIPILEEKIRELVKEKEEFATGIHKSTKKVMDKK